MYLVYLVVFIALILLLICWDWTMTLEWTKKDKAEEFDPSFPFREYNNPGSVYRKDRRKRWLICWSTPLGSRGWDVVEDGKQQDFRNSLISEGIRSTDVYITPME